MATTSPWVQLGHRASRLNTRPKVSWDGMPLGSRKNRLNHSRRALPNSSISTQLSAPQITPHNILGLAKSNVNKKP